MGQGVRRSTIPTRDYQKKRREIRSRKGTTATAWMRHMVRKIMQGDADGAEKFWHVNRIGGRDLEDLRQASKALMGAYNEAGRWLDTIRLFKWNEVARSLDERGKRRMRDVIPLKETGKYLKELEIRAKLQKKLVDQWANLKPEMGPSVDTALDEMRRDSSDDYGAYLQDLHDAVLRLHKIPARFMEEDVTVEVLRKFIGDRSSLRPFTGHEGGKSEMGIDGEILDLCFKALLERSDYEIILTLFYQYEPSIKLTPETWEYVLAAYVNLGRFKRAQGLIRYTVFREISISPRCYSVLLSSIRADGSWEKIVRHFNWLEKITRSKVPAIYHIMIQTAVERGMKGEANKYLKRMTDRGLSWTAGTCGALLSAQAKVKDWESLQKTLTIMDGQGFAIPRGSFNAVLNAYAEAKVYNDTETFFKFGLERGIIPDKLTYNIMIKASVYANGPGAEGSLPYWLQQMVAHGIRPDRFTFNTLFQDLRRNYGASASLLRRTYQNILRMQTSVKVLDYISKEILLKNVHYESKRRNWCGSKRYNWSYRALRASGARNREAIALRMASAIEANKPEDALHLWKEFVVQRQRPSFQMIILALRASLVAKNQSSLVSEILNAAKCHGLEIPCSIISVIRDSARKLSQGEMSGFDDVDLSFAGDDESTTLRYDKLYARIEEVYNFLDKNALPITHHVAVHSANRLINAGQPHAAIQLLNQVAKSKWGRQHHYDRVGYSVIMKAYCKAQDLNGIKWTVERVIALRLRPTTGIFSVLTALKERYLRESDENKATYVKMMFLRLRAHATKQEQDARKKAEFLVDFIRGTVGITKRRRFGTNWPLVTSGTRISEERREADRTADKLIPETKVQVTKGHKATPYSSILLALEGERAGQKPDEQEQC
ncbi:hypothetical protein L211DRAFT_849254 [Terfezia boudieri ATCC MYA-4762]|uniref:Pentacotripeptide-repeat region of PRORP domain-containing protein n=1 Tax=Terfezia boudieri ATCC MYA-4762 TaxID=1051890 RepID=A0A3N4M1D5_9PEZI|nr:hypothetical protein L211DRAFT_849254 [Terfezia boudieri ATCC MYA-4762]